MTAARGVLEIKKQRTDWANALVHSGRGQRSALLPRPSRALHCRVTEGVRGILQSRCFAFLNAL